jgi:aldehyde:ferredoxin oxidoreductase
MTSDYFGYAGAILRVNLSTGVVTRIPYPEEWMRLYLGGEGVAAKILYDEVPPETPALSPGNKFILSAGPLVGTLAPASSRFTLTTKSPITEIYSDSNAGGHFGPELKYAGYDHLIVEGAAEAPVYLWIDDDRVEIRDAQHLWGKTTWETEDALKAELGDETIQIACIGPAGEHQSLAACLIVNKARAFGRMGLGAVVGSKKLKAIAVRGTKGIKIANPGKFMKECRKLTDRILQDRLYPEMTKGILMTPDLFWDSQKTKPTALLRYGHYGKSVCENYAEISCRNVNEKVFDRNMACFACPVHCAHWTSIKEGPWKGETGEGFELNVQENFVYMDINSSVWLMPKFNFVCNQLGLGMDEASLPIAYAMWLFEKGILTTADTGGIDIQWGDGETVLKLLRMIAYREGFGEVLGQGTRKMGRIIGRGAEYWAKNIKGAEIIADVRYTYANALGEAVSPRGACHLKGLSMVLAYAQSLKVKDYSDQAYLAEAAKLYGSPYPIDPRDHHWVPYATRYMVRLMSTLDNVGICGFNSHYIMTHSIMLEDLPTLLEAATGMPFSLEKVIDCADRDRITQRSYNHRLGLTRRDDIPADYAFEHPLKLSLGGDKTMPLALKRDIFDEVLSAFYAVSGYDSQTGIPTRETLARLGISGLAGDLEKKGLTVN